MKSLLTKIVTALLFVIMVLAAILPKEAVQAGSGNPYDLIAAVNAYRNANGLSSLEANSYLMAAAQSQADYLAATYDIGSGANGHVGSGGSNASDRAYAFGYGNGKAITVSENWAGTSTMSAEELVYSSFWADYAHQNTMLDGWGTHYQDIGVGVATQETGVTFYVMDVGVVDGSENYTPSNNTYVDPQVVNGTAAVTYVFTPLLTSTPKADGNIYHTVRSGDTLYAIAKSYGVTADRIRDLNGIAEGWTMINEGDVLLILLASEVTKSTGDASITATESTMDGITSTPTNTMAVAATKTPRPKTTYSLPAVMGITVVSSVTPETTPTGFDTHTLGIVILIVCGLGLIGVVGFSFIKPKSQPVENPEDPLLQ